MPPLLSRHAQQHKHWEQKWADTLDPSRVVFVQNALKSPYRFRRRVFFSSKLAGFG